ncbi:MAG: primosomal protein N' [Clostridiales bacterium]|nr:primosomal protein N' [Clostridiales bacterium]
MERLIAKIAVSGATYWIDKPYDYIVPESMTEDISVGMRVIVPFSRGNRPCEGLVLALSKNSGFEKLKCISSLLDKTPALSDELIRLALWMRERFFCTVYEAVKAMLPAGLWYDLSSVCRIAEGVSKDEAYKAAGRSKKQLAVLDVLYANGQSCDLRSVELSFGEDDPAPALRSLAEKGVIIYDPVGTRRVKDKTQNYLLLNVSSEEAMAASAAKRRSAPSQAAVLALLADFGGASFQDVRYLTGAAMQSVKRLAEDELIFIEQREVFRRPEYREGESLPLPDLSPDQQKAFEGILQLYNKNEPSASLLYGVTGSGKTLVYIRLISEVLKSGRGCILLVPEISLTPQMLGTFSSYFGDEIALLHSSLSVGERYDEYKRIKNGIARLVIGTRSAVFAPVENLGLIIIDEEQEDSYKSENSPRYHACDVAKFRCAKNNAALVLGSATPDIVSRYKAQMGTYNFFELPQRFNKMAMPEVKIIDMKRELRNENGGSLSVFLQEELRKNISLGQQSILFLNRRGTNKLVNCPECGFTFKCPKCSVSLTYHGANRRLMCHYCGHSQPVGELCPDCGGTLRFTGAGTQMIEDELKSLFPDTAIIRMDTDTVSGAGSHEAVLSRFRDEKIPIMIGTQMVTKGLDYPDVTLVGVISADQSLYSGDYRASEKTFSILTQVVGRAGRGQLTGRAVIQTFTPQNEVILQAAGQDYDSFYISELEMRRLQFCPPFSDLFSITATGVNENLVLQCLSSARGILHRRLSGFGARVLGPAPLSVVKVNNRFRYRLTVYCKDSRQLREEISGLICYLNTKKEFKGVSVFGDINPVS